MHVKWRNSIGKQLHFCAFCQGNPRRDTLHIASHLFDRPQKLLVAGSERVPVLQPYWKFPEKMKFEAVTFGLLVSFLMLSEVRLQSNCNYFQTLEPGQIYYVYNPGYPNNYTGKNYCIWKTESPYIVQINCTLNMPANNCKNDILLIESGNNIYSYCGQYNVTYEGVNPTIIFSSNYSTGGNFLCTVQSKKSDKCECGWKNPSRIVGGIETGVNEYPMMAGLVDVDEERNIYCGATIISNYCIITAAHCINKKNYSTLVVVVGEHDVDRGETNATKVYRVKNCTIHPQYNPRNNINDIAVCKTSEKIEFSIEVGPACLPFEHYCDSFIGDYVTLLGWGTLYFGGEKSNTLQKVEVSVINYSTCQEFYSNVTRKQMCTYTSGKDACQMDSGGPVLWQDPSTRNIVLVGIIAGGIGCAGNAPALNTRVGAYMKWIISVTPGEQYCKIE